jgi:hypothetical protein
MVEGEAVIDGREEGLSATVNAVQGKQRAFSRPRNEMIYEPPERVEPFKPLRPGGHEPATKNYPDFGAYPFQESDHCKGAKSLTQVIQGEPDNGRLRFPEEPFQAPAEIGIKRVELRFFCGSDEITAPHRRKTLLLIIRKSYCALFSRRGCENAADVRNYAPVAVKTAGN